MKLSESYSEILRSIVGDLEKGVSPWRKPWGRIGGPSNFSTGRSYNGGNWTFLSLLSQQFEDPRYATLRQINKLGGKVRSGEAGYPVIYWSVFNPKDENGEDMEDATRCFMRLSSVFNISQTEGLPEDVVSPPKTENFTFNAILEAENVISLENVGCPVVHGGEKAAYSPIRDRIFMPEKLAFKQSESYYSTLFHETVHATGHKSRLDRDMSGSFGDDKYAKEELIAEIGAAFVCSKVGIDNTKMLQSASYLKGWASKFAKDKEGMIRAIISASSMAQKAADFITKDFNPEINSEAA